jgi:methylmalonyl-CoA mutase C-terminal domain/subunit
MIARAALDEDVDAVGISVMSGAHLTLMPRIVTLLRAQGQDDVVVFGGGIIPDEDMAPLAEAGIEKVFLPGATIREIVSWLRERVLGESARAAGGTRETGNTGAGNQGAGTQGA